MEKKKKKNPNPVENKDLKSSMYGWVGIQKNPKNNWIVRMSNEAYQTNNNNQLFETS